VRCIEQHRLYADCVKELCIKDAPFNSSESAAQRPAFRLYMQVGGHLEYLNLKSAAEKERTVDGSTGASKSLYGGKASRRSNTGK
jgi:hypothetical protein